MTLGPLAAHFEELARLSRCLQVELADRAAAGRLLDLAEQGRKSAAAGDRDGMLDAARLSRVVLDEMSDDARAGLAGATLRACDACLDRLDRPLTP